MQVVSIRASIVRIPLKTTIRHASHARRESENLIVEVELASGIIGYGEGVPRDYVTGETAAMSLELLQKVDWQIAREEIRSFEHAVGFIREFQMPSVAGDDRRCIGNAARCAFELAWLDAYGREFARPLTDVAANIPECQPILRSSDQCRYSGVITSKSRFKEALHAYFTLINRFKQCKIKVGTEGQDDVARLRRFRKILGKRIDLRIDANEAWSADEVEARIRELEPFGITGVEQPVPHEQVACLGNVRMRTKTPIVLDESLCGMVDAERAIEQGTCDVFNIRLSKCGGLTKSLELAAYAQRQGLAFQMGCQVGETGILSAAGRHFACSVGPIRYLEGSFDRYLVKERLIRENLTFAWKGLAPRLVEPGLSVTVDPKALRRISMRSEALYG